jgi:hypothetical protein
MENGVIYGVCLVVFLLQFVLGAGVTLLLRRRLPRAAYFLGYLAPLVIPVALWLLYAAYTRSQPPCPPEYQLSCGETTAYALLLAAGVFVINLVVSALVQLVLWLVVHQRNKSFGTIREKTTA